MFPVRTISACLQNLSNISIFFICGIQNGCLLSANELNVKNKIEYVVLGEKSVVENITDYSEIRALVCIQQVQSNNCKHTFSGIYFAIDQTTHVQFVISFCVYCCCWWWWWFFFCIHFFNSLVTSAWSSIEPLLLSLLHREWFCIFSTFVVFLFWLCQLKSKPFMLRSFADLEYIYIHYIRIQYVFLSFIWMFFFFL